MGSTTLQKAKHILTATMFAAGCSLGFSNTASADDMGSRSTILFAGGDARQASNYRYLGMVHHFSGDLLAEGPLLRLAAYDIDYEYYQIIGVSIIEGDASAFEAMVGYQKVFDEYALRGFIGLEYEDHDLTPDNLADSNRGSDTGVKVMGEFETHYSSPRYASLMASYGSAKRLYWARLRGGHDFSGFVIGAEGLLKGDREFDEQRIGAFLMTRNIAPLTLSLSGGYSRTGARRGGSSAYAGLELSTVF